MHAPGDDHLDGKADFETTGAQLTVFDAAAVLEDMAERLTS
jgi:hypothetical protein